MKVRLKEDPSEWRKSVLLTVLGVAMLSSLLRWRRVLPGTVWLILLAVLAVVASAAVLRPSWFRGYYRFSTRAGVGLSYVVARVVLVVLFVVVVTPLGLALRLLGKDLLRLKRVRESTTYWSNARESGPLDRMF